MLTIDEQIAAAEAEAASFAPLTPEDTDEIAKRAKLDALLASNAEEKAKRRALDLDRRLDAAKAKCTDKRITFSAVDLEEDAPGAGTYIVATPRPLAWDDFQEALTKAKNGDTHKAELRLAVDCICDPDCQQVETADEVRARLGFFKGATTKIANECMRLGGLATQARKSRR